MARSTNSPIPVDRDKSRPSTFESSRLHPTATDTLVAALAPALIIGMICCLVFFLITITCRGDFTVRLMVILGLYTFASVLVARIAIEQSRTISMAYTGVLGIATLFVVLRYVPFSGLLTFVALPLTIGFLVLIGFLADRITFDCTLIDDSEDGSGVGLLQSLGVVHNPLKQTNRSAKKRGPSDSTSLGSSPLSSKVNKRKHRHNPGVWVLYFAIFAIPLFGLGQLTIPASEPESRRAAYWFLFGYLLFSLSLLVATSFLGLRRYLRQRQIEMPLSLSTIWIGGGIVGVLLVLLIVSLVPLPSGSQGVLDLPIRIETATKLQSSRLGWGKEGTQKDAPNSAKTTDEKSKAKTPATSKPSDKVASQEKAESKESRSKSDGESKSSSKSNETAKSKKASPSDLEKASNKQNQERSNEPNAEKKSEQNKKKSSKSESQSPSQEPRDKPPSSSTSWSISFSGGLSNLLRWMVSGILILIVVYSVVRYRDDLMVALRDLAAWWRGLFGIQSEKSQVEEMGLPMSPSNIAILKSFSDFVNPFSNRVASWNASKIIRHTFEAIEVWGRERQLGRSEQETPEEFLRRLASHYSDQSESLLRLMQLYNRLAYANSPSDPAEVERLSNLWNWLGTTGNSVIGQPKT